MKRKHRSGTRAFRAARSTWLVHKLKPRRLNLCAYFPMHQIFLSHWDRSAITFNRRDALQKSPVWWSLTDSLCWLSDSFRAWRRGAVVLEAPLVTVFSSIIPAYSASKLLTRELSGPAAATLYCYNMYVFAFFPAFCHAWLWVKRPAMEGGPSVSYAQMGYCLWTSRKNIGLFQRAI